MAQRPSFGALKKTKPALGVVTAAADSSPAAQAQQAPRIQTSVRLDPAMWAALNDLATRKRIDTGRRVTVHDLLIEGGRHVLAANGIKLSRQQGTKQP
jgi:hypothetical protein